MGKNKVWKLYKLKYLQLKEFVSRKVDKKIAIFICYFVVLFSYGIYTLNFYESADHGAPYGDHGLILYTMIRHIQKVFSGDLSGWTNMKIFYPSLNTLAYTDHFYLHSLIGAPYYLITKNPLATFNFVFLVQLAIAMIGYYVLVSKLFSRPKSLANLLIITVTGLFFVYNPLFVIRHPQINFYGLTPWIIYFFLEFFKTKKLKYMYLFALTYVFQINAGIYLQLFVSLFLLIFLIIILSYLVIKKELKQFLSKKLIFHYLIVSIVTLGIILAVNYPYINFSKEVGVVRSMEDIIFYSADPILSYFVPRGDSIGDVYLKLFPSIKNFGVTYTYWEAYLFMGISGAFILILSWITSLLLIIDKKFLDLRNSKRFLVLTSFLLFAMYIFSLGPFLRVLGTKINIALPYYFLYKLSFVFRSIRVTSRIIVVMALPVSLLMCFWVNEILKRKYIKRGMRYLCLVLFIVITICDIYRHREAEHYDHVYEVTYIYDHVNDLEGDVLLELPSGISCINLSAKVGCAAGYESYYAFMHIYHDKWTINGYSGYYPPVTEEIIGTIDLSFNDRDKLEEVVEDSNIDLILIHKKSIDSKHVNNYEVFTDLLDSFMTIAYEDDKFTLFTRIRAL